MVHLVVPLSLPLISAGQAAYHHLNSPAHPHLVTRCPLQTGPRQLLADLQPILYLQGPGGCTLTD